MLKIPLSWIKEHLDIKKTPQEVGDILTGLGLEVDAIHEEAMSFEKVVVGEVVSCDPHPNADKLVVAKVSDGREEYQVVCGAPNCKAGMKSAFAKVGARLKDEKNEDFEVKSTKIRGIESFGMLCSAHELKIGDDKQGIMDLNREMKSGADLGEFYRDVIFEISLTPNMGHNLSLMGVVREISAATGITFTKPEVKVSEDESQKIEDFVSIDLQDTKSCPRYTGRLVRGVKVERSPVWLERKLESCGIRSINNIVDITNYVMMEMGQPMHAFNYDKMMGGKVVVRRAINGEKITTLDGKERVLSEDYLVVADEEKPLAIAGVMGDESSGVDEGTVNVLLESAYFSAEQVRKSGKLAQLSSDSSKRFERGVDFQGVSIALDRASMLIEEICGVKPVKGVIDQGGDQWNPKIVHCRLTRIEEIIGVHVSLDEVETIFNRLLFTYKWDGKNTFRVEVPSFRHDINQEIDVIEEVVRIYGYNNIPLGETKYVSSPIGHAPIFLLEQEVKKRLVGEGLQEFISCDLISPQMVEWVGHVGEQGLLKVLNPTSVDQSILRPSLIPGLLSLMKNNWGYQSQNVSGFEVGRVHFKAGEQYKEQTCVAVLLSGMLMPHTWDGSNREVDFFDLKGIVENLFSEMHVENVRFEPVDLPIYHTGRRAKIVVEGVELGTIGEIHPAVLRMLDLPQRMYIAEWNLHDLYQVKSAPKKMTPLALYPSSSRDWTLTLKESTPIQQVLQMIRSVESPYLEEVSLKDIYRSEKVGEEKKNVTIHFVYRDREKTISQETADVEHAQVTERALKGLEDIRK